MPLLGFGFGLLGRRPWMIRDSLDGVLIHRLRALGIEGRARWDDPVIGSLGSGAACAGLDAAGIDALLGFATRQVSLGIDRALTCEVLPLLGRIGVADDDQLGIRFVLQARCYVIEYGLASVVHTPRLYLVREVAGAQLGRNWRRWR